MKNIRNSLVSTSLVIFSCLFCVYSQFTASEINKLKSHYSIKELQQQSRLLNELDEDTLEVSDTTGIDSLRLDSLEKIPEEFSIYEKLLKKEIINPDSILEDLEIFGHSVFRKVKSPQFKSENQISVPADYPVASGDEIIILLWGRINEEHHLTVDRNGKVNIPRIGPVSVAGLPFKAMQKNLTNRIQTIEGVQAAVSMGTLSDIRVFVVGEVNIPGQYTVSALTNVTNALFFADGFSKNGSMRHVKLKRNGRTIKTFDFYKFLLSGDNFGNVRLKTGDVIFIPVVKKMAAIAGNVRRSALYELKDKTGLKDLIDLAGGLTPNAWVNRIQVERFQEKKQQVVLDLDITAGERLPDFTIEDGDIVKIFPVVQFDKNAVFLSGNVTRPGKYEFRENMRVSDLLNSYDHFLPETYFNYAVIRRQEPPSYAERIISFNLGKVLEDSSSPENIALAPLDNIIIYNQDFFERDREVSIDGSVTNPGTYKLLENMCVKDLILEAGGLSEEASNERGELYKRTFEDEEVHTEKIDFNISAAMQDNPDHNIPLSKFDHVSIRPKQGWEEQKTISLVGEFNYPGSYIVLEGETLGNLIKRAGGFKPDAYLSAAIYTRESVKKLEKERTEEYINKLELDIVNLSNEMTLKGNTAPEAQALLDRQKQLLDKLKKMEPIGRVVIDFENEENYRDLQIEDGDVFYVPKDKSTVSVIGEVFNPATFVIDKADSRVYHYIQLSGGYKENANKRDVYVIKANGSVRTRKMVRLSRYNLEPGDAVVVPFKLPQTDQRFKIFLETTKDILAITSSMLLIAITIKSIQQK